MAALLGAVVIARNGDRLEYYQDPQTYKYAATETTALGEVESHQLGALLRSTYLEESSPSFIKGIQSELVDNSEIKVRVKAGGEGTVVFDSAIALLQGLFPPTPKNKIVLANETTVTAPLGGYQYVPVETVNPGNDRSLEPWTDCPSFKKHISDFHSSKEFKEKAKEAEPFFAAVKDYVFGRTTTLENSWNLFDFINSELTHNKSYAHRLPPTFIDQARGLADFHENGVFSDKELAGIGHIAGRSILPTIIDSLERIVWNQDPLQFLLVETTYQPFISLFHQTEITKSHPETQGIPNYASALVFELRKGSPPDDRDFLRVKFKNGTHNGFETLTVFGHRGDIPLTEFIYRLEGATIKSNREWAQACGVKSNSMLIGGTEILERASSTVMQGACMAVVALVMLLGLAVMHRFVRRSRAEKRRVRLEGEERINVYPTLEKGRLV